MRNSKGRTVGISCCGECLIASAKTSTWGGLERLTADVLAAIDDSNKPYRGRGGRSGVALLLLASDADADRARNTTAFLLLVGVPFSCTAGDLSGVLGAV